MLKDSKSAPKIYQPTNFWENYIKSFLPELKSLGLHDFRRRKNSVLSSFGATDMPPSSEFIKIMHTNRGSWSRRILNLLLRNLIKNKKFNSAISYTTKGFAGLDDNDLNLLCYEYAKSYGEHNNALPISGFEASLIGNPENIFETDGKNYTISILAYYVKYAFCCRHIDFENINSMAEIGPGLGKQTEVIKQLYPKITFYHFDLPTQLYVSEQYLSALFPDSVVSYRETRNMKTLPKDKEGKIFIFAPWKIQELADLSYDFFFNFGSFQEMEPDVVLNYLKYVNQQCSKYVFLGAGIAGNVIASKKGKHGVLEHITIKHYEQGLSNFHLEEMVKRIRLPKLTTVKNGKFMLWKRKC